MFRREGKVVCIVSAASDGATVCYARTGKDKPHVLYAKRALLPLEDRSDEQIRVAIVNTIDTLLKDTANRFAPDSIHVVVHEPWSRFGTASGSVVFEKERSITKALIDEVARSALEKIQEKDAEAGVVRVFLNGYPTERPLGKRAHSLETIVFGGSVLQLFRTAAEHSIGSYFPGRRVHFHTGARVVLTVAHERMPQLNRFVVLSIRGMSECMVIRHETETQYGTSKEGVGTILKHVAPHGLPEETLSLFRMAESDFCSTDTCNAMKDVVARAEPELVRSFGDMFAALASTRRLPNDMLLFAPAELMPWLSHFFTRIDFSQFTTTTQPFSIQTMHQADIDGLASFEAGIVGDAMIATTAAAVNMFEE